MSGECEFVRFCKKRVRSRRSLVKPALAPERWVDHLQLASIVSSVRVADLEPVRAVCIGRLKADLDYDLVDTSYRPSLSLELSGYTQHFLKDFGILAVKLLELLLMNVICWDSLA